MAKYEILISPIELQGGRVGNFGGVMKEKQVIVQWYDSDESYPEHEGIYICTCDIDMDDISLKSALVPCYWSEDTGWLTTINEKCKIIAWCDLKAYK